MRALMAQSWEKVTARQAANYDKNTVIGFLNEDKWLGYPPKTLGLKPAAN